METQVNFDELCRGIRRDIVEMIIAAQRGHLGGSFSVTEILAALYFGGVLQHQPKNPNWENRDRLIMSKGHAAEALWSVLARRGFFPVEWLTSRGNNTLLGGHVWTGVPGVDWNTGSLGHGLSVATGMAWAAKLQQQSHFIYAILGDGDLMEGQTWEAILFASQHQLNNLIVLVDFNQEITLNKTPDCLGLNPLVQKFQSFRWHVAQIKNGHNVEDIIAACQQTKRWILRFAPRPIVIICHTVKGYGTSVTSKLGWHHRIPNLAEAEKIRQALK